MLIIMQVIPTAITYSQSWTPNIIIDVMSTNLCHAQYQKYCQFDIAITAPVTLSVATSSQRTSPLAQCTLQQNNEWQVGDHKIRSKGFCSLLSDCVMAIIKPLHMGRKSCYQHISLCKPPSRIILTGGAEGGSEVLKVVCVSQVLN